jgi:hypothetical protein
MVLLAALGLNACDLEQLSILATSLSLRLGAEHRSNVLRVNLTAALETSLNNFGTSIKTWIKIPAMGSPPCLNAAVEKLIETRDAIELFQAHDLTAFGFMSSSETISPTKSTLPSLPSLKRAGADDETNGQTPKSLSKRATLATAFCRDFLNGHCDYVNCKFKHHTLEELQATPLQAARGHRIMQLWGSMCLSRPHGRLHTHTHTKTNLKKKKNAPSKKGKIGKTELRASWKRDCVSLSRLEIRSFSLQTERLAESKKMRPK